MTAVIGKLNHFFRLTAPVFRLNDFFAKPQNIRTVIRRERHHHNPTGNVGKFSKLWIIDAKLVRKIGFFVLSYLLSQPLM